MGGRIYDSHIGRFLQADPFVQSPSNSQNFNRYSYVLNNPLSYTDPSGYFYNPLKKVGRNAIRGAAKIFGANVVNFVGSVVSTLYGGPWGAAAWSYEFNRAMGASSSAAFKSAAIAGASVWAFSEIGGYYQGAGEAGTGTINFGGNMLTAGQVAGQITAHAMVGGVAASLQGGKFGHGFFSAGVTKGLGGAFLPGGSKLSASEVVYGTVVSAMIGGTASVVAGGKFANGAQTAAMQYLMNQLGEMKKAAALSKQRDAMLMEVRSLDLTTDHGRGILALYAGWFDVDATYTDLWGSHHDANTIRLNVFIAINTRYAEGMMPIIGEMAANQYGGYTRDAVLHVNPWTRAFVVPFCFVSDTFGWKACG